jgi:type I restriction enzyme S subunit
MALRPGYKQTEVGVIPEEWEAKKLGDFVSLQRGHDLTWRDRRPGDVPVMGSAGQNGFHDTALAKGPGVVLGRSGASFGQAHYCETDFWPHNTALYVTDFRGNDPLFVFYFLSSIDFTRHNSGGAQQSLNRNFIYPISVRVPRPVEQPAIAGALGDVDALIGALTRLIAKKRDFKQAAMQQLLTPPAPGQARQTRLPGFSGEWEFKRLGDCLISRPDYGINAPAVPFSDRLPSYIRITDISEHSRFSPEPRVSVRASNADQYYLSDGDLVFARTGASVGKSYLYDARDGQLVFAGFLIRVRPNPEILVSAFLAAHANTKTYWNWVRLMSMRSGQPGINGIEYAQLPILLPSVPEQTAIAAVLSDMDAEIAALERRLAKTCALKQGMMQELLTGKTRLI